MRSFMRYPIEHIANRVKFFKLHGVLYIVCMQHQPSYIMYMYVQVRLADVSLSTTMWYIV